MRREMRAVDTTSSDEKLALDWVLDRNQILRDPQTTPAGKILTKEVDVSGGLDALLKVLRSDATISRELRHALARALDPNGTSIMQVRKRLRRKPGRPAKCDTVRGAVKDASNNVFIVQHVEKAIRAVKKRRPMRAAGTALKKAAQEEIISVLGISKTELGRRRREHNSLISRKK